VNKKLQYACKIMSVEANNNKQTKSDALAEYIIHNNKILYNGPRSL